LTRLKAEGQRICNAATAAPRRGSPGYPRWWLEHWNRLPVHLSFVSDIVYYVAITIGSIVYFRRAAWYQKDV